MGFFSYMCNECGKNITSDYMVGEQAVMFHVRHGVVVGAGVGEYDGYGRLMGSSFRNGTGENEHETICDSEFRLEDSGTMSGIIAFHIPCLHKTLKKNMMKLPLQISKNDDAQGYGRIRKNFSNAPQTLLEQTRQIAESFIGKQLEVVANESE